MNMPNVLMYIYIYCLQNSNRKAVLGHVSVLSEELQTKCIGISWHLHIMSIYVQSVLSEV